MENQPSLDELRRARSQELRTELTRRGLPRAYINRLVAELDDHFRDLLEERNSLMGAARKLQPELEKNCEQRLGEPAQLAIFAADQYHARTFWGRHPILTYLLGPLPLLVACWIVFGFVCWAFLWGVAIIGAYGFGLSEETFLPQDHLMLQAVCGALFTWYAVVFPPLAAALLLCRTYRRNAIDWRWPLAGCALVATVAALFDVTFRIATGASDAERGLLMLGFNVGSSAHWLFLTFLPKFAVAIGIAALLIKRAQQILAREDTEVPAS